MAFAQAAAPRLTAFLLVHALLIPASFALAAVAVRRSGIDMHVSAVFFDSLTKTFPARSSMALELFGHRLAKSAVGGLWLVMLAIMLIRPAPAKSLRAGVILSALIAMVVGPVIVVLLKDINSIHCPWNLKQFGGYADASGRWFVLSSSAGHCFPSGHASAGFSLIALHFAGIAADDQHLRRLGLAAALIAGSAFSLVRIMQGAHFLSHNLWSAAIDWCAAALAFSPLIAGLEDHAARTPAIVD